jgi:GH15 family glucan-1,4-alpha-glucosidase
VIIRRPVGNLPRHEVSTIAGGGTLSPQAKGGSKRARAATRSDTGGSRAEALPGSARSGPARRQTHGRLSQDRSTPYPAISEYGFISDSHSVALVSTTGSIDWCCMPRVDAGSVFGRLLDWERGGYCQIVPRGRRHTATRRYLDGTLVLETTFRAPGGAIRVLDCFTMRRGGSKRPHRQLLRIVEGVQGRLPVRVALVPRFDYGEVRPWIRRHGMNIHSAIGGNDALVVTGDFEFRQEDHSLHAVEDVRAGERLRLSLEYAAPEDIDPAPGPALQPEELDRRLEHTIRLWRRWSARGRLDSPDGPAAIRSGLVLKGLTRAPTGAIAAAATTSLPEAIGGERNWDYRFSWIRDSWLTVRSLAELGYDAEADGFRRFVERSAAGHAGDLQIVYGVGGERRLIETTVDSLEGYRKSRPVRVGNDAHGQDQHDVFGSLLELAYQWHRRGRSPDDDYWQFLVELVGRAAESWEKPDPGIWEIRTRPRHFVHSKVMCWAALDRGLRLAKESSRRAPVRKWTRERDRIRRSVERDGYDRKRGVFVRAYGSKAMDAALLLIPVVDFCEFDDERMVRTTDRVREELEEGGLLRRYRSADGMSSTEGTFLPAQFWLAEAYARQGRLDEAREAFDRGAAAGNDLGLFSEEFDAERDIPLGNFPQGLTHLAHISAAVAIAGHVAG